MSLNDKFDLKLFENYVREYYDNPNIKDDIYQFLNNPKNFIQLIGYVDGPPTMNGDPHLGHIRGRIIKDIWYRKSSLEKKQVIFRPGWDAQGLPVELQAEKILGLKGNKTDNIEKVGIEKIVQTCKKIISDYNKKWVSVDKTLGMSFDYENSYWTYTDEYIELEWKYIEKAFSSGILKEWFRVVAYCPSCQTSLSNAEINQSYEQVEDPSLYYKVKLTDSDLYLIVWTTMPFTLITDELVGVSPNEKYAVIEINDLWNPEKWVISENRLHDLLSELKIDKYKILDTKLGKELDGKFYNHPFLEDIPGLKELSTKKLIHYIVADDFVDVTTGSGIVHLSPANGEQDFEIATKRNLPIFVPIDDKVMFNEQAGSKFNGFFVRDCDNIVVDEMRKAGALVKIDKLIHKYPTCWRSHHKIVWLARREYFYMIDKLDEKPLLAATKVNYYYDPPKNRYLEIIKEKVPWCISRERFWGTPLPIWKCKRCSYKKGFFSRSDIIKNAESLPDGENFELHRPWIDRIKIRCPSCQNLMDREAFVLDTWHNSGSAPFASFGDKDYKKFIPVEFLTEGIDQTRGWAYTLLMLNIIFTDDSKSPFNSFLFTGHVLDEKGNKMSKSLGNVIEASSLLNDYSVDLIRFYFMWKSSPIEPINFNIKELQSRPHQILSTLFYLHVYFLQNSQYDKYAVNDIQYDGKSFGFTDKLKVPEIWILTKLERLIIDVTTLLNNCRFHEACRSIEDFIINSLSQTYVPLIRYDLWSDDIENKNRRYTIYDVLFVCLKSVDVLLHPICPFISEYLYLNCFKKYASIIQESWPKKDQVNKYTNNMIEKSFDLVKEISSLSFALRNKSKLKRRWPLESAFIYCENSHLINNEEIKSILNDQLNIEKFVIHELKFHNPIEKIIKLLELNAPITPIIGINRRIVAKKVKSDLPMVLQAFSKYDIFKILDDLRSLGHFNLLYDGDKSIDLASQDLDITYSTQLDFISGEKDNNIIIFINKSRNDELVTKGLIRDLSRNIQQLRKELGYNPTQLLSTVIISNMDSEEINKLELYETEIAKLVRVRKVIFSNNNYENGEYKKVDIDGKEVRILIK